MRRRTWVTLAEVGEELGWLAGRVVREVDDGLRDVDGLALEHAPDVELVVAGVLLNHAEVDLHAAPTVSASRRPAGRSLHTGPRIAEFPQHLTPADIMESFTYVSLRAQRCSERRLCGMTLSHAEHGRAQQ